MNVENAAAFGSYLRAMREHRRMTLELLSHRTKIAERLLSALERGDLDQLPPGIYRRGMIRACAAALGLDPDSLLQQFERASEAVPDAPQSSGNDPRPAPLAPGWAAQARQLAVASAAVAMVVATIATAVRRDPAGGDPPAPPPPRLRTNAAAAALPIAMPGEAVASTHDETVDAGTLRVGSEPPGAVVTVNGIRRGFTPLMIGELPLGRKRVRVILDGYVSAERMATLEADRPAAVIQVTLEPRQRSADRH